MDMLQKALLMLCRQGELDSGYMR